MDVHSTISRVGDRVITDAVIQEVTRDVPEPLAGRARAVLEARRGLTWRAATGRGAAPPP